MSDDILSEARRRLDRAQAEVREWTSFIERYESLAAPRLPLQRSLPRQRPVYAIEDGVPLPPPKETKLKVTERVAVEVIRRLGRPVPSAEMLEEIVGRGVDVGGTEPASTLAARLSRSPVLEFVRGRGWWTTTTPVTADEAAGSRPHDEEPAASAETTNHAVVRGEVALDNMTS